MEFNRVSAHSWVSHCGLYRISCIGNDPRYIYSASFKLADGQYEQLGLFESDNSQANADAAKAACNNHHATRQANV